MAHRFLVIRLAGKEFAVPAARICGMLQMRGLQTELLEGRDPVRYMASLHGRTLPIFVPNSRLGLREIPVSARTCLLLIRESTELSAEARYAIMVDSVSRLEEVPPHHLRPPRSIRLGEKWREVLDLDALCGSA